MDRSRRSRREFCAHACRAASLAALGGALGTALQGCGAGGSATSPSSVQALSVIGASVANGAVTLAIDSSSPLASVGSAALLQTTAGFILVAHVAQDSFNAFGGTCTHQACTITGYASNAFVCPCHGSRFDTSGRVLSGPAPRSLPEYKTQFANNVLTITP